MVYPFPATRCGQFLVALLVLSTFAGQVVADEPAKHPAWTASRVKGSPDPAPPYRVELAFDKVKFDHPLDIAFAPGSDRLFVAEQGGKIFSFPNDPSADKLELAIDLKHAHKDLSALYGVTFHPKFESNRYVYLCYVLANDKPDGTVVSRFEVSRDDPGKIDAATEQPIIRWWSGGHNGGCLKFGPDGYLYISSGDGAGPDPPDALRAGQDLSRLLSAILRIDVDQRDGDRPYRVPADNPMIGIGGARPEIWAHGFRNPWRMSFDRVTGDLWVGDVGWQLWEMIYRVERGGNYGWSVMEGPQPVLPEQKRAPTPILPPTVSHPHSEAASITGGVVYHGNRLPELKGAYVYGDFQSGKIWGLRHDGKQVTWQQELAQTPLQLVAFGEDKSGEIYLLDYERTRQIHRLVANPDSGRNVEFPRKLSQSGLFTSVKDQSPAAGVMRYSINAHHWSDHTSSDRWMAIPGNNPVKVHPNGTWEFPDGSVLAKTVGIEMEVGNRQSYRRLETQILHREDESWRPYTYAWNDAQTDAELVSSSGMNLDLKVRDPKSPGGMREQSYRIASRAECQLCHNPWVEKKTTVYGVQTASPLAVSIAQLNRKRDTDATENSLKQLVVGGWVSGIAPEKLDEAVCHVDPYDAAAPLELRARSYLHVNCSHCHQLHAGGSTTIDLTFDAKLEKARLIGARPTQGAFGITHAEVVAPGDPLGSVLYYRVSKIGGGRMPRLGSEEVDDAGVRLIHDWIKQLPATASAAQKPEFEKLLLAARGSQADPQEQAIRDLLASTRGALALLRQYSDLPETARQAVVAQSLKHPQAEVRELFERFIPVSQRPRRLGNSINRTELLALVPDADRGKQTFFRDGAASCKSCHRVQGQGETLGPDLSQIGKKYTRDELLTHLLEPSRLIDPKYIQYTLETRDGRVVSGLLVERTAESVVLKNIQHPQLRFAAGDIEELVPQQKSMMPDLLLRDMTLQQVADLLAYLSAQK